MTLFNIKTKEYNQYYKQYIALVDTKNSIIDNLQINKAKGELFFEVISNNKMNYSYAKDKWSIKEVLQHIIDSERVFCYRAFCIARNDKTNFPGFDQDIYSNSSNANFKTKDNLLNEYRFVRDSTIAMFSGLEDNMLKQIGIASGSPLSARAAGFICIGHEIHHCNVIKDRYL